jgi:hypothetical protein
MGSSHRYVQRHDRLNVEYFLGAIERPVLKLVLLWNGTLTRSATGFYDCFCKFSSFAGSREYFDTSEAGSAPASNL